MNFSHSTTTPSPSSMNGLHVEQGMPQLQRPSISRRVSLRRFLAAILILLLLSAASFSGLFGYIAWKLARPTIAPLTSNPWEAVQLYYEDIAFASLPSGEQMPVQLEGWYIPAQAPYHSSRTVIFSHGYGGNREELWVPFYELAALLHQQHFNVLLFDYGYVNGSQIVTAGLREADELLGAIAFAKEKGAEEVFIWGFSMGAGTALQAGLRTTDIQAMILDSTFLLDSYTLQHNMQQHFNLPFVPVSTFVEWMIPLVNQGISVKHIPMQEIIHYHYPMPILFIHGEQDALAPYEQIAYIASLQQSPALAMDAKSMTYEEGVAADTATPSDTHSNLWLIPQGEHELLYQADPAAYMQRINSFLQNVSTVKPAW